jgi:nicotinic acid mononucleotide adenylyltransferase
MEDLTIYLVYSGAFCPIHYGHIQLLTTVKNYLLNKNPQSKIIAYIAPSGDDYVNYKLGLESINLVHRCEMVKIMSKDYHWIHLARYGDSGPDTVRHLKEDKIIPKNATIYEIGGIDYAIRFNIIGNRNRHFILFVSDGNHMIVTKFNRTSSFVQK